MFALSTLAVALGTLSITVSGNHFVNQNGQTVRLLGVDHQGTEYACQQGWAYSDGDDTAAAAAADVAALSSWHVNAVRLPLNEDCWLGINGQPSYGTVTGYRQTVERLVSDLNANGIYTILDLHWSAPGSTVASGQWPMADQNSIPFWTSVASTFAADPAVVFDAFNEPYSPAYDYYGDAAATTMSWSCWENGGCALDNEIDGGPEPTSRTPTYTAVGMQQLVNAIRSGGATQPIMLGGLSYSNDLTGWLAHEPTDPDDQLVASLHAYEGQDCATVSCFDAQVAPVAAKVPVVIGEFDEDACAGSSDDFDQSLMSWADGAGVSYLAWGWIVGATPDCGNYYLNDASDDPVAPNGTLLKDHLAVTSAVTGPVGGSGSSTDPGDSGVSGSTTGLGTTTNPPVNTGNSGPSSVGGSGQSGSRCRVPELSGQTLPTARRRLRAAHCRLGEVVHRGLTVPSAASGRRAQPLTVVRQHPAAGHTDRAGARVEVWIARAAR